MYASLQRFEAGIDGLISYIDYEEAKREYFKDGAVRYSGTSEFEVDFRSFVTSVISSGATNARRFLYNSMIVSLYGYLESYIEEIVEEYISKFSSYCENFVDIPSKIREQHLDLSMDLVKVIRRDRNLSKDDKQNRIKRVIQNMNSCINELNEFNLNEDAYSIHTANFRYESIHSIFHRAGVANVLRMALEKDYLRSELARVSSLDIVPDKKILISLLTAQLDDLAQRRNEVSHGSLNSDLQSMELFKSRALFVKSLGVAIHDVVSEKSYELIFPILNKFNLGRPSRIFQGLNVLGYQYVRDQDSSLNVKILVGDEIYSYNENSQTKLIVGKILALKCNGEDVDSIDLDRDMTLTIQVDYKVTSHMQAREIYLQVREISKSE